jgi:TetR/AcrR family transcriptional regulator, lmrAB and yxaGH operons repressor
MKDVRPRMITGAAQLLAQKGLQGASFAEVLELTGAPRGSVYHHFPQGKDELVTAALDAVGDATIARIEEFEATPVAIAEGFLALWRDLLDRAHLTAGCAVVAVSVAAADELLDHAGAVFARWTDALADRLVAAGLDQEAADDFATLLIATTEGAVIMCRAQRSRVPFDRVAARLTRDARQLAAG